MIKGLIVFSLIVIWIQITVYAYFKAIEKEKGIQHERKPFINHIFTDEYLQARRDKQAKKALKN
ncbi:hypothetical protein [Listeria fleischmannii]|uniref:Uncharacterized protein n=1 Tax=Listeria fleischmannii FSL S10-1203 TaxID=1265822 RepID=W7DED8_9LIST|nr:hypothetical protein [Listeria fleischmannii]EUJ53841.1 hypothetical protein MCOL2_10550 [Listeria fleischmannii FSL S10-1203]